MSNQQTTETHSEVLVLNQDQQALLPTLEEQAASMMAAFTNGNSQAFFSTIQNDGNRTTQIKIYNAISEAEQLSEHQNVAIPMTDYMAHPVVVQDDETGEITPGIRLILVGKDGTAYACVSGGVQNSLQRLVGVFGAAPWSDNPVWVKAVSKGTRNGNNKVLTLVALTEDEIKKADK